jgi:beta-N-acetylhexosaminidase
MRRGILIFFIFIMGCSQISSPNLSNEKAIKHWSKLTLREKVAQMIMVRIRGDFYSQEHWYRKSLERWISKDGIGGVISFGGSIHGTFYNISTFQSWAKIPLLVSADYERGLGQWMRGGTLFPSNMAVAATGNPNLSYQQGEVTAKEAKAMGVHITLSPVLDVNNNPENPIINFRSYSDDPGIVIDYGNAFIKGVQDGGLYACAKHFPGHGNTNMDSHSTLPSINGTREELEEIELKPFKSAIENGVKMIMVGHIAMPGLDPSNIPASYSKIITTGLLRDKWGFKGLIITDGMEMGGLTESTWAGESAIRAVEAGADILLLPMDVDQTIDALVDAVQNGRLTESRIDDSVKRIWSAKEELGVFTTTHIREWTNVESEIGKSIHTSIAKTIAEKSITIVKNNNGYLPLQAEKISHLTHLIMSTDEGAPDMLQSYLWDVNNTHSNVDEIYITQPISKMRTSEIVSQAKKSNKTLVTLLVRIRMDKGISTIDSTHAELLSQLNKEKIPFVVFSFGSPYLPNYEYLDTYVCAYGYGKVSQKAAANVLWGRKKATGKLPINLNNKLKRGFGLISDIGMGFDSYENIFNLDDAWAVIDSAINDKITPGAQVFIAKNGKIVSSRGFGFQTYDNNSPPITEESIYDVASLTKVLATTPITMKLIAQKKIGLEQRVSQFFPQFNTNHKDKITIRHLLTHSSGLKPFVEFFKFTPIPSEDEILGHILDADLDFIPGKKYQYSDLGMIVLKEIIEDVSNRPLNELAHSWLYKPLGMKLTMFNPPGNIKTQIVPTEIDNIYRKRLLQGEVHDENAHVLGGVSGHAGIFSTASDIGKYSQMMLNDGLWIGRRTFKSKQVKEFTQLHYLPKDSERTLGWDTPSMNGKSSAGDYFSSSTFGHLGYTGTSLWIDPENEIIVVLLTNRVHPTRERGGIYGIRREFHTKVMKTLLN